MKVKCNAVSADHILQPDLYEAYIKSGGIVNYDSSDMSSYYTYGQYDSNNNFFFHKYINTKSGERYRETVTNSGFSLSKLGDDNAYHTIWSK